MRNKFFEKRKTLRHEIELVVSITQDGKLVSSSNLFKNISTLGCLVIVANHFKFKQGDKVILQFENERLLKEFNLVLDPIDAEVKHFDNSNETFVGFEFFNVSDKNKKIIQELIDNKFILKKFPKSWQISK